MKTIKCDFRVLALVHPGGLSLYTVNILRSAVIGTVSKIYRHCITNRSFYALRVRSIDLSYSGIRIRAVTISNGIFGVLKQQG